MKTHNKITMALHSIVLLILTLGCSENEQKNRSSTQSKTIESLPSNETPPITDIHSAVISGNLQAIEQHIKYGTNLNSKDPFGGSSPLISAALFDKKEIAELLLDAGADINFTNNDGSTALHTAAFFCRPEIVQLLLDKGIDKNIRNNMGATAFESVAGPFKDVEPFYDMIIQSLSPYGFSLSDDYLIKTRPIVAEMLK